MGEPRVIAWFSRGAASAVATKLAIDEFSDRVIVACIALDTEHPDSQRFADECEEWFGQEILYLRSSEYADTWDVWERTRFLVGPSGARCTVELKKRVRHQFEIPTDLQVFGYTADEVKRAERFRKSDPGVDLYTPLIDAGITKDDALRAVRRAGIALPAMYEMGYSNNNCIGCVKGGMGYWNAIRRDFPEVFNRMATLERNIGHAILSDEIPRSGRKKRPVWLDELDPNRGSFKKDQPASCSIDCQEKGR